MSGHLRLLGISTFIAASSLSACSSSAQTPLAIAGVAPAAGSAAAGTIEIPARSGDSGTSIPFTILRGRSAGPTLLLVAGTHGAEYVPIVALQRLRASLDPSTMRGNVLMIHVANMPSFLARTVYYSPADNKNLNRVFPGKADGTLSERIADVITSEFIARATHVVDLHCGDGNESLRPYSYWITTGDPKVAENAKAMALAFGLDHIVVDGSRPTDPAGSVYLSNTAVTRGKPALTTETGGMALVDEDSIGLIERGVAGLMRHLDMRTDGPAPVATPVWLKQSEVLRAAHTGIFYPAVKKGDRVSKGAKIGHVTDFHGKVVEEIAATFDGQVLYVIGTPPISKGEPVAMLGAS